VIHDYTNENKKSSQTKHKTYENETKSNTPRAQGGKGLLSHSISVQVLKNPLLTLERRGRKNREREREQGRGRAFWLLGKSPLFSTGLPSSLILLTSL